MATYKFTYITDSLLSFLDKLIPHVCLLFQFALRGSGKPYLASVKIMLM